MRGALRLARTDDVIFFVSVRCPSFIGGETPVGSGGERPPFFRDITSRCFHHMTKRGPLRFSP